MTRWLTMLAAVVGTASTAPAGNLLSIRDGAFHMPWMISMWGIEHPDWRTLPLEGPAMQAVLQPWAERGVNTIGLTLHTAGAPFFTPAGEVIDPEAATRFSRLARLIRDHHMAAAINVFEASEGARLESADAYRRAVRHAAELLPRYHCSLFVLGDPFADPAGRREESAALRDRAFLLDLARLMWEARSGCFVGVPVRTLGRIEEGSLLRAAATPEAMARLLTEGTASDGDHRDAEVAMAPANQFLLRADMEGGFAPAVERFLARTERRRLAFRHPPPPSREAVSRERLLTPEEAADGWQPLFDGRSLEGWTTLVPDWGAWRVEDGMILCGGTSGPWLHTRERFDSFILRLDFRISPGGNSGVFIHAPLDGRASRFGMEVQIIGRFDETPNSTSTTGAIYSVLAPSQDASRPAGEWNSLEIACRGSRVSVTLNGKKVQDFHMDEVPELRHRLRRGVIGLQDHDDEVAFRKIRIKRIME